MVGMAFSFSCSQLRKLPSAIAPGLNIPIVNELGLLRRPRYAHRETDGCFYGDLSSPPAACVPAHPEGGGSAPEPQPDLGVFCQTSTAM